MKKRILFVMNNLTCGGAEKSLISLLQSIDYSLFEVDLLLFRQEGIFMNLLPEQVNLLDEPVEYQYFDMSIKSALLACMKQGNFKLAWARLLAGYIFKTEPNVARCEQRVWKYSSRSLKKLTKEYDAAIGYLEKKPIYFVTDKVMAKKKLGFIHTDYDKMGMDPVIDNKHFEQLDHIVSVSEQSVDVLMNRFPTFKHKVELMYNIVSSAAVTDMASVGKTIEKSEITLTSVGRLIHIKGFNMAVEACEMLIREGYKVKWYVVGEGEERNRLEKFIHDKRLEGRFILTGLQENPYPYMKQCDIYVHTSLFEGRPLTITEAKVLHKPIVSTNFESVYDQLTHERNGIIVERDSESIFKGIKRLIDDVALRQQFVERLKQEQSGTEDEIQKLYQWIS
ncbi:glycosyltransferase [Paenibacillus harenae]|uniref:Glycosyltransferase involved in cell wall biosynthesis n=1 Tax=Paenibacillus harenae TaxID=306543 RepID=A0ABT9U5B0_PAEHA|nr:glycosyltransferase [Paenibacillus harenae]MDQ0114825.1 glycosyltransferase involved in cell wall biosynthesis [Paenibacillus harenae]